MDALPKALQSEMAVSKKSPCVIICCTKLANFFTEHQFYLKMSYTQNKRIDFKIWQTSFQKLVTISKFLNFSS